MSAAVPPPPPPHIIPVVPANGASQQRNHAGSNGKPREFAHIKDLLIQAEDQVQANDMLDRLLQRVSNALSAVRMNIEFGRPDYALVEGLVAQIILSNVLPRHKDLPRLRDQPRLRTLHADCIKRISLDQPTIDRLVALVKENNRLSGVKPRAAAAAAIGQESIALTLESYTASTYGPMPAAPQSQSVLHTTSNPDDLPIDKQPSQRPLSMSASSPGRQSPNHRTSPPVRAKPFALQGNALAINGRHSPSQLSSRPSNDPLLSRFSNLRITSPDSNREILGSNARRHSGNTYEHTADASSEEQPDLRKDLPQLPSPTYNAARPTRGSNVSTPQPGRSFDKSDIVDPSAASTTKLNLHVRQHRSSIDGENVRQSQYETKHGRSIPDRSSDSNGTPYETAVDAQKLFDYLTVFNVLLIDVRTREEFDGGHIWNKSVVCIEPVALRQNRSAEELQDTLVIGTDDEAVLFSQRDEFDLVVYFDQRTESTSFLRSVDGQKSPLRCLHDSLFLYNNDKPLKREPILLIGGMDAWTELIGKHSLKTSETVQSRAAGQRPARPLARRPVGSGSRLNVNKKRHRDYNPLAPEEERKWRDRTVSEAVALDLRSVDQERARDNDAIGHFQLRYPDVPALEYQVMGPNPPTRPRTEAPQPLAAYVDMPPAIPSRPAPVVARPSYRGVSERVPSQSPQASKTAYLPQHIPNEMRRLPRTGLYNFGVTCYMNATIQCLSATLPLSAFFLTNRYQQFIQKDNWKGSKGILSGLYAKILESLWRPTDYDTIRPKHFRQFCARLNQEWGYDRQQDAKEFLEFLVDTLHEDLNAAWARNPLRALTPDEEAARERTPPFLASKREFARYTHRDNSRITDFFAGQHISRLQCTTCRNSSSTYETFYSMSVEIPPSSKGKNVSIHDCLRSYCSAEMLSGDEVWRCPYCNKEREATKRITISRAPEFLVIHFKRFSASHLEKARKVHTPVEFPLTALDIEPYMLPAPDRTTCEGLEKRFGAGSFEAETPRSMQRPFTYDAYAVMRHLGNTMTSGHYTALCKDQSTGMWRDYNDDRVSDFRPDSLKDSKRLQNEQAYIVFYQRTA